MVERYFDTLQWPPFARRVEPHGHRRARSEGGQQELVRVRSSIGATAIYRLVGQQTMRTSFNALRQPRKASNDHVSHGYNHYSPVLLLYIGLYVVGMLAGLAAKIALDVQLRRPGIRQVLGLIVFALLLWGVGSVTHAPFTELLLPIVWAGTGLLAGLGSREMHTAS